MPGKCLHFLPHQQAKVQKFQIERHTAQCSSTHKTFPSLYHALNPYSFARSLAVHSFQIITMYLALFLLFLTSCHLGLAGVAPPREVKDMSADGYCSSGVFSCIGGDSGTKEVCDRAIDNFVDDAAYVKKSTCVVNENGQACYASYSCTALWDINMTGSKLKAK